MVIWKELSNYGCMTECDGGYGNKGQHDLTKIVGTESNRHRQGVATKFSQHTGA